MPANYVDVTPSRTNDDGKEFASVMPMKILREIDDLLDVNEHLSVSACIYVYTCSINCSLFITFAMVAVLIIYVQEHSCLRNRKPMFEIVLSWLVFMVT